MTTGEAAVLRVEGVSKWFGPNRVLTDVSLRVRAGRIHAVVGENGAGKSTLMNILGGLYAPERGTVFLDGHPVAFVGPLDAIARGIGMVHQELSVFPNRTVAENVFARREPATRLGFLRRRTMAAESHRLLARLGASLDPDTPVGALSVGAQQLVEIAKALSQQARVLILDEPTSALSDRDAARLFAVLEDLRRQGVALVYITHKLGEVLRLADDITVLRDGRVVGSLTAAGATEDALVELMVGRRLEVVERASREPGPVRLVVEGLTRAGRFTGIGFTLEAGEILGFAGLMGSGRTEVARALFGADPIDAGTVSLDGRPVDIRSPRAAIRRGLAYLTEDRQAFGLFLSLPVAWNIVAASQERVVAPGGFLRARAVRSVAARLVERLDVRPPDVGRPVGELSGGNQQKVLLAKWLGTTPRVLIADEPTRGVDVAAKHRIHQHLRELAGEGVSIILISSELPEVLALSDRVAVFRAGRLVTILDAGATEEEIMRHAAA